MERFSILSIVDSFSAIIEAWDRSGISPAQSQAVMAADFNVPKERVRGWWRENSIPSEYWQEVVDKAPTRGIAISPELLIELAARD